MKVTTVYILSSYGHNRHSLLCFGQKLGIYRKNISFIWVVGLEMQKCDLYSSGQSVGRSVGISSYLQTFNELVTFLGPSPSDKFGTKYWDNYLLGWLVFISHLSARMWRHSVSCCRITKQGIERELASCSNIISVSEKGRGWGEW